MLVYLFNLFAVSEICVKAREKYTSVKELFSKLRSIVPEDEFYRYSISFIFVVVVLVKLNPGIK